MAVLRRTEVIQAQGCAGCFQCLHRLWESRSFQEFSKPDFVKHWIIGAWCKNKRNKYNSNFPNYFLVACSLRFWGALGFARWKLWAIILIFGCGLPSCVPFTVLPLEPEMHHGRNATHGIVVIRAWFLALLILWIYEYGWNSINNTD